MMTVFSSPHTLPIKPTKRVRRTATAVMAGAFDERPQRDVLTSLLNGVPRNKLQDDKEKRLRKERRKKAKGVAQGAIEARQNELVANGGQTAATSGQIHGNAFISAPPPAAGSASSFWRARPTIHIATMQRSISVTPPPASPKNALSTPGSTPGPSISSSTSRTSSKRPRTPTDFEDLHQHTQSISAPMERPPRKKRDAAPKGWKGWVPGSPQPSDKLINLDAVPILQERRTRSGKNFDAIGVGKDGWV